MLKYLNNIIFFGIGACVTYYSPYSMILTSCFFVLILSFTPIENKNLATIYSGTFAGMSSKMILSTSLILFLASILGGFLCTVLDKKLIGIGGKLGTIAFLSVLLFWIFAWV